MRKSGNQGILIGYTSVMKNIDSILSKRLDNVRQLANLTAREMVRDFRGAQQSAEKIKSKTKGMKAETVDNKVNKAVQFAKKHEGDAPFTRRGVTWSNRTDRAVRGVNAIVLADTENITLRLSHGIYYGAYLEYAYNRKYAVLEPLIRQYGPDFFEQAKRIMGGAAL